MTEAEAKTKWCPFARVNMPERSYNRAADGYRAANCGCIASACMAWRWMDHYDRPADEKQGLCGLAGMP